jgi:hypothetical protein
MSSENTAFSQEKAMSILNFGFHDLLMGRGYGIVAMIRICTRTETRPHRNSRWSVRYF